MSRIAERTGMGARTRVRAARPERDPAPAAASGIGADGRRVIIAIFTVMGLQVLFLLVGCDWDLCNDEAEYWAWSRRLDWGYFSRGPLIAWLIRLSTEVFGGLSLRLSGSLMFAARLPAVLLGGLTAWGIFRLAEATTGSRRVGWLSTLMMPAIPLFAIGGVLITCDTPLVCCWTWAAVWSLRAIRSDALRLWMVAGVIGALGVLAKYSALALPASVGLFLLLTPRYRDRLLRPGFWAMSTLCVGLGMAPIVYWNARNGWVGAGQLADRVGLSDRAVWGSPRAVLSFLGSEVGALGGVWWFAGVAGLVGAWRVATRANRALSGSEERPELDREGALYLLCLWSVVWCACLAASLLGETEANWMAPGYIAVVVLIGWRAAMVLGRGGARARAYAAAWCASIAAVVTIHHTEWYYLLLARYIPAPTKQFAAPLRLIDITARMRGHQELARQVALRIEALRAEGEDPFVLTPTYALTSTLEFYLPSQPETYCLSWNYGMTSRPVNQHDLWHPNPRHDIGAFRGRAVVVVEDANMPPSYSSHLAAKSVVGRMEPIERVEVKEHGATVGVWDITVCRDYRGLAGYKQNRPGARRVRPAPPNPESKRT